MFDKKAVGFLKKRFEASLGKTPWEDLSEQLFCHFLWSHSRDVLQSGGEYLDRMVSQMDVPELGIVRHHFKEKITKNTLIIGDELGFVHSVYPQGQYVFYSEESKGYAVEGGLKNALILEELPESSIKGNKILVLGLLTQLKEWKRVPELGKFVKAIFDCMGKKGELFISDKSFYQDDFLIHLVSLDADIETIQSYANSDFLLRVTP